MTRTIGSHVMDGYDIAGSYQPHFNWQASRNAGDELAAFKGTEGAGFRDTWFTWDRLVTSQLGFRYRCIYAWIKPGVDIAAQLRHFVDVVGDLQQGEFIQLDEEEAPLTLDECVLACELFSQRYPGRICHYGGASFDGFGHVHPRLRAWPWWMASWRPVRPLEAFPPTLWQWGGSHVDGFPHDIDSNQIINRPALEALAGYVHPDPVHTGGTDVINFVQLDASHPPEEHDPVFLSSNTATLTWMKSQEDWAAHLTALGWPTSPLPSVHQCASRDDLSVWGALVGPFPPGWVA